MTAPVEWVRAATYRRDSYLCADCGVTTGLSWQHRESSGHGGRGKRAPKLTPADGVTLCLPCNQACEAEGQERALHMGWKLRRFRGGISSAEVPFYVRWARQWVLPDVNGGRRVIAEALAQELLAAAGAFTTKGAK